MKYQESYSGGRSEFSRMNSYQARGYSRMIGTLIASHATAAAAAALVQAPILPARRHSTSSGPSSSTG